MTNYKFTSESVSAGHPDKIADQISDAILDAYLALDPASKMACETLCTTNRVVIAGEVNSTATINAESIARGVISQIGYTDPNFGFDANTCEITNLLHQQSPDIRQGVERDEQGAGDQGIMFGYAVNESKEFMPATLLISHLLLKELENIRKEGREMLYLRPDAKSQVTIEYSPSGKPLRIDAIVLSTQHTEDVEPNDILDDVLAYLIPRVEAKCGELKELFQDDYDLYINPTGRFVIGGPDGDTGLTGRKIIVDTYGGRAAHGGGAFSGKDSSKVDRSAAYMARYIAKNLVAAGVAEECQVQLAYAIGVAEPVSIMVNTFGTTKFYGIDTLIAKIVAENIDLRPAAIIERFGLRKPIFAPTAAYGHFGRKPYSVDNTEFFGWERLDMVDAFKVLFDIQD